MSDRSREKGIILLTVDEPRTYQRSIRRPHVIDRGLGTVENVCDGHHVANRGRSTDVLQELATGRAQTLLADLLVLRLHDGSLCEECLNVSWVGEVARLFDSGELDRPVEKGRVLCEAVEAEDLARATKRYRERHWHGSDEGQQGGT